MMLARMFHSLRQRHGHSAASGSSDGDGKWICGLGGQKWWHWLPAVLALASASAAPATPRTAVALGGPEVIKLDWNTRALHAVDLNGDGRLDLVLINNDRGRIELLYQLDPSQPRPTPGRAVADDRWEPVLEDARFRKESLTTGVTMYDLAVGDLNGDGRPDLVYTSDNDPLTIRYQQPDGRWGDKVVIDTPQPLEWASGLKIADLNGDGRNDIVMLAQKELVVIRQTPQGTLAPIERYPLTDENCYGLTICDVNGDGRPDLVYLAPGVRDSLRVRLQTPDGDFGSEQSYKLDPVRGGLALLPSRAGAVAFASIHGQTGQMQVLSLVRTNAGANSRSPGALPKSGDAFLPSLRPQVFSPRVDSKTPAAYAFADFDGDGTEDLAVSDPDGAQVFMYLRRKDGEFSVAHRFPSLADGRSIAAGKWEGDKKATLFVASPREQSLATASLNAAGRLDYPQPLPMKGRPLAVAFGPLRAGGPEALVVAREEGGRRLIDIWTRTGSAPAVVKTVELAGLKTDPRSLKLLDANQDGLTDIAVFVPYEPLRLLLQKDGLQFEDASAASGFRKGMLDDLDPAAFTLGDVDGDGRDEMLVAQTGFVRALRIDAHGTLVVVDQYNARDSSTAVAGTLLLPAVRPARPGIVFYDRKNESFQLLRADALGVYTFDRTEPAGKIDLVSAESRRMPDGRTELFFLGKDRFWRLPLGQSDYAPKVTAGHTTDLTDVSYGDVVAGDLNGSGVPELVCIDPSKNVVEVLGLDGDGTWRSRMHFKVFDTDAHFMGRKGSQQEPREAIIADVTGDGKKDLVLLVHDRILIYPQE